MFHLTLTPFGPYQRYDFHDAETNTGFSVVPAKGATLTALRFSGQDILDGYATPETLTEGKWGKSALLFPYPNRLRDGHFHWQGKDYQWPLNNAATGNAIHGFVRGEAFEVLRTETDAEQAQITCRLNYKGQHTFYPFPLVLDVTYAITKRGEFNLTVAVRNTGETAFPFGFGWHPYFRLAENAGDMKLQLPACTRVEIDDRMIPTGECTPYADFLKEKALGETSLDNCFAAESPTPLYRVQLQAGKSVALVASSSQWPFFQVFTPPHRGSVALEPMTCNVDSFHNEEGLLVLDPGESWIGACRVTYE